MRFPTKYPDEKIIAKDRYGNALIIIKDLEPGHDFQTDGRIKLSRPLAARLARIFAEYAKENRE